VAVIVRTAPGVRSEGAPTSRPTLFKFFFDLPKPPNIEI
jgi:hypothetical protein